MLASVAAMQGRIAMKHALGEAVQPLDLSVVSSNVFTDPEIATVGVTQQQVDSGEVSAAQVKLPFDTNARAKMQDFRVRLRQAVLSGRHRDRDGWSRGGAASERADLPGVACRATGAQRRPSGRRLHGLPVTVWFGVRGRPPAPPAQLNCGFAVVLI